jgi:glycosyltransferase involved in cell wall biosynthesis
MRVTVAICTWNRAELLDQTLTTLRRLAIPFDVRWEVLVVNNACTDGTDEVLTRQAKRLPLRRLYEPTPGKSRALNAAIRAIDSDLILWSDDDVLVDPHWLAEYVRAASEMPDVAFFGGPIEPWFEADPPTWIRDNWQLLSNVYAARDFGDRSLPIDRESLPFGANYAIRTSVQKQFLYNTRLGRIGPGMLSGEETELFLRLLADGHRGQWCASARLAHFVPKQRLTERHVREYFFGVGQSHTPTFTASPTARLSNKKRFSLYARAVYYEFIYRLCRPLSRSQGWPKCLVRSSLAWGRLAGLPQEAASPRHRGVSVQPSAAHPLASPKLSR